MKMTSPLLVSNYCPDSRRRRRHPDITSQQFYYAMSAAAAAAGVAPPPPPPPDDIPSAFICPISLDLMSDPVLAPESGQTFDRSSIERWLASGNATCPLTRAPLQINRLLPNHALRRLIRSSSAAASNSQYCIAAAADTTECFHDPHALDLSNRLAASLPESAPPTADITILLRRIGSLASASPKLRRHFVELGIVSLLASLALDNSSPDCHASESLGNASDHQCDCRLRRHPASADALTILTSCFRSVDLAAAILHDGARIARLTHLLLCRLSTSKTRAAAAAAVASLAAASDSAPPLLNTDHARQLLGSTPHLFPALVSLLSLHRHSCSDADLRQQRHTAIKALFALCLCAANWAAAIEARLPAALLEWLAAEESWSDIERSSREMAVATLELLCKAEEGRREVAENGLTVAQMGRVVAKVGGGRREAECAAGVLLAVARESVAAQERMVEMGVMAALLLLLERHGSSSSERAKKKAIALLKLLHTNWSHHPSISNLSDTLHLLCAS